MGSVVIDANLAVGLVRQMPYSIPFRRKIEGWVRDGVRMAVPGLWDYEVTAALRKLWFQDALSREEAVAGLERLLILNVDRFPAEKSLLMASLRWAERLGQSKAYDAQYVALAEQLKADLWSADQKLIHVLKEQGITWAHWIGEE